MNVFSKIFIACISIIGIVSCTDMNGWGDSRTPCLKANFIYFPQSQIELGGLGNLSATVQLQAVSTPWKISNPATDWLTVSPMEGTSDATVTFTAKENPTSDNIRTAILSLESADASYSFSHALTVNQSKANSILTPSEKSISFTRESQTLNIIVSANTNWTASCSASWIHVTKVSDTSLDIQVDENNDASERNATITLSGSTTSEIKVTQTGISVTPSLTSVEFTREAQTKTIDIASNYTWTASSTATWIHLNSSPSTGKLSITVDENNQSDSRSATITINGGTNVEIKVTQDGISATPSKTSVNFTPNAGTETIDISSNYSWTASCSATWIHLTSSPSTGKLSISVDENNETTDRTATIIISGGKQIEIKVIQTGKYLTLSQTSIELSKDAQTKNVDVTSNYNWAASSSATWIHPTSSPSTGTLSIAVDENRGTTDRTDNILLSGSSSTVSVVQHGYTFDDLISELDFETASSTQTLNIKTDGDWTAAPKESWIHVSPATGTGDATISVTVDKNDGTEIRKGTISVTVGNVEKYVSVQQKGSYIDISTSSDSEIPTLGGTRTVSFSTSDEWTVECKNTSWVSVDKANGSAGINTITLSFIKNSLSEDRSDTTLIKSKNANLQSLRIISVQKKAYLELSSGSTITTSSVAGSCSVIFTTSENWTVENTTSWITVNKTSGNAGDNTITLIFSKNSDEDSRSATIYIKSSNTNLKDLVVNITQQGEDGSNGHEYVDLGLPSGTLWATSNVNVKGPYFAWGEITGGQSGSTTGKREFDWSTYLLCNRTETSITKYCTSESYGTVDNLTELELADDVARQKWGGNWRIPSKAQFEELKNECASEWTTQRGTYGTTTIGLKITSKKNDNSIFLPANGETYNSMQANYGVNGYYWSRTLDTDDNSKSYEMSFGSGGSINLGSSLRCAGYSIRPVLVK